MAKLLANSGDLYQIPQNGPAQFTNYPFGCLQTKMG